MEAAERKRAKDARYRARKKLEGYSQEQIEAQRAARRRYNAKNKERQAEWHKAWVEGNKEKKAAARREWAQGNVEKRRASARDQRARDPDRFKAHASEWKRRNPGKVAEYNARRRAARLRQMPPWADRDAIKAIYQEAARLRSLGEDVHVDHIYPLKGDGICGLHIAENLRIIPALENLKKGNRAQQGVQWNM